MELNVNFHDKNEVVGSVLHDDAPYEYRTQILKQLVDGLWIYESKKKCL